MRSTAQKLLTANANAVLAIVATCLQIPMLISMFFIEDLQLTEDEQIILAGKRIGLGKKKQEKVDEREGEEVKTVEKEKPVVKADKASLMGDDS